MLERGGVVSVTERMGGQGDINHPIVFGFNKMKKPKSMISASY